jgi:HD-GYP domain-containing protein (c-di-GMP phosphodiesterase class II)
VGDYAQLLANTMQLPKWQIEQVQQAAVLHDIGKIGIAKHVLQKNSRLTEDEFAYIKTHTVLGATLVENNASLKHLAPFVRYHHERWDGKGYPEGLQGAQIPLEARIIAVCDTVDAMASDRPYHRGKLWQEIIAEIKRSSGTHFDPCVATTFIQILENNGAQLIVNSATSNALSMPGSATPLASSNGLAMSSSAHITQFFIPR